MYAFRIVNVFTVDGDPLSGNPLCVFEDARGLSSEQMQALARQMNLSETTFVLPSDQADAHVRIFTPGFEMPFAGHPTLGTSSVIANGRDKLALQMKAGIVHVTNADGQWTLKTAKPPTTRPVAATRDELCAMLGLPSGSVSDDPSWVDTGVEQLVIPIASPELVRAAKPVLPLIEKHGFSEARDEAMAYLCAKGDPEWTVRFFFTSNGALLEDPATGSACANLGGYFIARGEHVTATLSQGTAIERPSRLHLRADNDGIFVSGAAIELGRGTIVLAGNSSGQT